HDADTPSARLDPVQRSHGVSGVTAAGPGAEGRDLVVGEGADHGDAAHAGPERQELAVVLEQHDRLFGHASRELAVLGCEQYRSLALGASAVLAIIEQAEGGLGPEHTARRLVDPGYGNAARPDPGREIAYVEA